MIPKEIELLKGIHPGLILDKKLKEKGLKKGPFALSIKEYAQTLGTITKGKRDMNTPLAMKLENALNLPEGYFMILQVYYDIKELKRKEQETSHPDLKKLRTGLFWDTNIAKIDWHRQKKAIIERIFERGDEGEKAEITRFYGADTINKILESLDLTHAR